MGFALTILLHKDSSLWLPVKIPHKPHKKTPNKKAMTMKTPKNPEIGSKPPKIPLSVSKNTSDSFLNQQRNRTQHIPLELHWEHWKDSRAQDHHLGVSTKTMMNYYQKKGSGS